MIRPFYILLSTIIYLVSAGVHAQDIAADHLPKTVILKVKPIYRAICGKNQINDSRLQSFCNQIGVKKLEKKFPGHHPPVRLKNANGERYADLSTIYELSYNKEFNLSKVLRYFNNLPVIAYAEPHYIPKPLFIPNDDSNKLVLQYHLDKIQAYAAWDSTFGDTNIVIGITDSGVDTSHIDLKGNIKYNYADPIDGIDNDNDGFIDNFRGWDLADNDNAPIAKAVQYHGIYVTGLASAVTNNGQGIAGVGFRSKFLPVKISRDSDGAFIAAYEGIVYAADHGCQIINCSWGGVYVASQFNQDVITYASINKNALVIAAAGNSGDESVYNPASLKYVLSVGGTDTADVKPGFSSYGIHLDLCAPGSGMYSLGNGGAYGVVGNGTSYAAPIVAGCAAIVKSVFPNYNSIQIGEQLKVTSDRIDTIAGNSAFAGKLGAGRVNLYRAITETDKPSIVMTRSVITDGDDDKFAIGDTISVGATFKNYLDTAKALFVKLESNNSNIEVLFGGVVYLGLVNTLDSANNYATPFKFRIKATAQYNEVIDLKFTYTDGTYSAVEYITLVINMDMVDIEINDISSTITSESRFGYNDPQFPDPYLGLGFMYKGEQLLYEAGLMIGATKGTSIFVSDNVLDSLSSDSDFTSTSIATALTSPIVSQFDVNVQMNDDNAGPDKMNIGIEQNVYAWSNEADDNYIITEFEIINNDNITLDNIYVGIFADWDVGDYSMNRASEEHLNRIGYVTSNDPASPYVGVKLLSSGPFIHYAIDNYSGPGIDIDSSSYSTSRKYTTLSTNRAEAGIVGNGNDVCDVVSTGPFTLLPNDTLIVAFALIAGDDFMDMLLAAQAAQVKYDSIYFVEDTTTSIIINRPNDYLRVYPNPANSSVSFIIGSKYDEDIMIKLFNLTGKHLYSGFLRNGPRGISKHLDTSTLENGIYHYVISSDRYKHQGKLVVIH